MRSFDNVSERNVSNRTDGQTDHYIGHTHKKWTFKTISFGRTHTRTDGRTQARTHARTHGRTDRGTDRSLYRAHAFCGALMPRKPYRFNRQNRGVSN